MFDAYVPESIFEMKKNYSHITPLATMNHITRWEGAGGRGGAGGGSSECHVRGDAEVGRRCCNSLGWRRVTAGPA
jgi:hypothetical protein